MERASAQKCVPDAGIRMSDRSNKPVVFTASLPEEPPKSGTIQRRSGVRFPVTAAAEVFELRSQTRVTGRCSDLGLGGCYVDTLIPFAAGSAVRVRIERDGSSFEAAALVSYAHVSLGMGLAFTEIKPADRDVLRRWTAALGGESAPEPAAAVAEPEAKAETADAESNLRLVLNELIAMLVRKKILSETEAARLLLQTFR